MNNLKPRVSLLVVMFSVMMIICLSFSVFVYAENDFSASNSVVMETNSSVKGRNADIVAQQARQYTAESAQPVGWVEQSVYNPFAKGSRNADIAAKQARRYTAEPTQLATWKIESTPSLDNKNNDNAVVSQGMLHTVKELTEEQIINIGINRSRGLGYNYEKMGIVYDKNNLKNKEHLTPVGVLTYNEKNKKWDKAQSTTLEEGYPRLVGRNYQAGD